MISLILLILGGIFSACVDVLRFRWNTSIFRNWPNQLWVNPNFSWRNKWKDGDPEKGEKFLGSSTIFVWLTDFWHLCKFIMILLFVGSIVFYNPMIVWWLDIIILYCSFTIIFELFFSIILVKK